MTVDTLVLSVTLDSGCRRKTVPRVIHDELETYTEEGKHASPSVSVSPIVRYSQRIYASWYDVPEKSLARRRAGADELTAAHDHLPLGTRVRVFNPETGNDVIVRITDRGLHSRKAKLDVCKEAAEQLGFIRSGIARVRMDVLDDDIASTNNAPTPTAH